MRITKGACDADSFVRADDSLELVGDLAGDFAGDLVRGLLGDLADGEGLLGDVAGGVARVHHATATWRCEGHQW